MTDSHSLTHILTSTTCTYLSYPVRRRITITHIASEVVDTKGLTFFHLALPHTHIQHSRTNAMQSNHSFPPPVQLTAVTPTHSTKSINMRLYCTLERHTLLRPKGPTTFNSFDGFVRPGPEESEAARLGTKAFSLLPCLTLKKTRKEVEEDETSTSSQ